MCNDQAKHSAMRQVIDCIIDVVDEAGTKGASKISIQMALQTVGFSHSQTMELLNTLVSTGVLRATEDLYFPVTCTHCSNVARGVHPDSIEEPVCSQCRSVDPEELAARA